MSFGGHPDQLLEQCLPLLQDVVRAAARRSRLTPEDAEDLLSEVQLKLLENEGQALRSCQEPDRLRAFLATTVARHQMDRRNHDWGKWRPCAEAKRQGPDAKLLDQLVTRDRLPFDEVVLRLREKGIAWTRQEIERRAALFPERARRRQETDEGLEQRPAPEASPEQALVAAELAEQRDQALRRIAEETSGWPFEDTFCLRAWMSGQTVTALAKQLNAERRPLYRKFEEFFLRLRLCLEGSGIGLEEAREILSLERWEGELPGAEGEDQPERPSERIEDDRRRERP